MGKLCSLAHPMEGRGAARGRPRPVPMGADRRVEGGGRQGGGKDEVPCLAAIILMVENPLIHLAGLPFAGPRPSASRHSRWDVGAAVSALYRRAAPGLAYCDGDGIGDDTSFNAETLSNERCFIIETLMSAFILTHLGRRETLMDQGLPDYEKWG